MGLEGWSASYSSFLGANRTRNGLRASAKDMQSLKPERGLLVRHPRGVEKAYQKRSVAPVSDRLCAALSNRVYRTPRVARAQGSVPAGDRRFVVPVSAMGRFSSMYQTDVPSCVCGRSKSGREDTNINLGCTRSVLPIVVNPSTFGDTHILGRPRGGPRRFLGNVCASHVATPGDNLLQQPKSRRARR